MSSLTLALAASLLAASSDVRPATSYDPAIPTVQQVLGHASGEAISTPEQIAAYLKALAAAAPERTRLVAYGESWEGRPLHVLVIAAPERIAALDALQADLRRLADPRTLAPAEAERLARELPVVVWLLHAVHGNEVSSSDAALLTAYHLLAARGDGEVERILREAVVLLDPLQNPDGRARFLGQFELGRGPEPDPEPASAEHDEPWPGGRTNHYLFDMNRDWFALTQRETRARVAFYRQWYAHVVVDLHEMSGESSYYFAPPADPLNPHIGPAQRAWLDTFGRAVAADFDARGWAYFNREVYDSFYPGYGDSWPIFNGAVGMTFEQASPRGLLYRRRSDQSLLTYLEAVRHHFGATLATLSTAAAGRGKLVHDFLEYRRDAVRAGESGGVREYLLPPGGDPARAARLAELLLEQGIEVRRAEQPLRVAAPPAAGANSLPAARAVPAGERTLPAGTFIVPLAQPAGFLARNLLDPRVPMDEAFVREQDRRRRKRLPDQIYDLTGWSLPLAFDVPCVASPRVSDVRSSPLEAGRPSRTVTPPDVAKVAYLMPWGVGAAQAVVDALAQGLAVRSADRSFTLAGRPFEAGTALLRVSENPADLHARVAQLALRHGVEVVAADSGFVDEGLSLGSAQVRALRPPRVLLAWDEPVSGLSAGAARFVLERRYGQRISVVRVASLRRVDLRRYDVLVLPSGDYTDALAGEALRGLKHWVKQGGTLIVLGDAARWAARDKVGLLDTDTELRDGRPEPAADDDEKDKPKEAASGAKKSEAPKQPVDLERAVLPADERPEALPGALLRVALDREHWLSAGTDGEVQAIVEGRRVFSPLKLDKGRNVGVYAKDDPVASGLVWDDARPLLEQKAYLMDQPTGDGHVIAFAEDPNFRGFAEATQLLFLNAVLLGPAHQALRRPD